MYIPLQHASRGFLQLLQKLQQPPKMEGEGRDLDNDGLCVHKGTCASLQLSPVVTVGDEREFQRAKASAYPYRTRRDKGRNLALDHFPKQRNGDDPNRLIIATQVVCRIIEGGLGHPASCWHIACHHATSQHQFLSHPAAHSYPSIDS